ncbi:MAG: eukaryotic-like serine/threonine-protein kinase [Gemmatimonadales bacterium]|nr:eukaryotic-like serine/threonine-protein kinase [Gemmatimonadales bacterium]
MLKEALRGRYSLERELGQGGMATVYLARDLRHDRLVAVKVLRPELAATLGSERFLQEIATAARFQHPHILPLLDSGDAGGFLYYVMPYVEGESLRGRLARQGELPIHEAVKILAEVCDALAYAHARGVVHRDIKPDNVLLSGRHALVTDFGVAKALSEATGRQQLTTAGVALGTPAYMAPEQAAAEPNIDHRVDIYAVGVLGYELVSGRPPFTGRTTQEVLAAHITQKPQPLCARRVACPPELESVILRCLEKRPADRWQTADELLAQLEPLATPSGGTTPTATRPTPAVVAAPRRAWGLWLGTTAALLAVAAAVALALSRAPEPARLGRRLQLTLSPGLEIDPALSPDGGLVAYAAGPLFRTRLYVRQADGGAPVALTTGHDGFARVPRWSPDGRRLVFRSERGLELIPALGGASRLLVPAPPHDWIDGAWAPDGRSLAYALGDSVYVRAVDDGAARGLARLPEAHSCVWSTDGHWLACVSGNRRFVTNEEFGNIAASSVWVLPVAGGTPVRLTDDQSLNTSPAWLRGRPSLLYLSNRDGGRDIYQVHLTRAGRPSGDAFRLTTGLNAAGVSVAADGRRLVYATLTESSNVWALPIPRSGTASMSRAEPVTTGTQVIEWFDVSPDGRWLAFDSDRSGTQQIYRVPLAGGEVEQLTSGGEPAFFPSFSPDGREIACHSFRGGTRQIFVLPAEGGTPTQVTTGSGQYRAAEWSPDGQALVFSKAAYTPAQEVDLVTRDAEGRWRVPRTLVKGGVVGVWSPDGHSVLTAVGDASGVTALEIVPAGGGTGRVLLAVRNPTTDLAPLNDDYAWSADGQLVYFLGRDPRDGSMGVWRVPAGGGTPRIVVRFDDPSRPWHRDAFRAQSGRFYFTIGDQQSDIWVTEVLGSR